MQKDMAWSCVRKMQNRDHWVTLLVNWTDFPAEIDFGSALSMVRVYWLENLGNLEDTTKPVLVKKHLIDGFKCFFKNFEKHLI